jgi:hypothetical protein
VEPVIQLTTAFLAQADRDPETQEKYGPDYYDDPRAKALARIIETDLGVREVEILGGGSFGVAAATASEGGDVVKLTTDSTEVESGTVLTNTKLDDYPANVVHLQGAWYARRLRLLTDSYFDPKTEIWHHAKKRIGILRMERVRALDRWENLMSIQGLSEFVRYVKHSHKTWPHQTRNVSRAVARERYLHAGTELEHLLMEVWRMQSDQIARDVARAIGQLRAIGIYGTDFHGGNVGWVPSTSVKPAVPPVPPQEQGKTLYYRNQPFKLIGPEDGRFRIVVHGTEYGPFNTEGDAVEMAHTKIDERMLEVAKQLAKMGSKSKPRENPTEETIRYREVPYDLITSYTQSGMPREYFVRVSDVTYGPFISRGEAISEAQQRVDMMLASGPKLGSARFHLPPPVPPPTEVERELARMQGEETVTYKVFDVGMSSVGPQAPKPTEIGKVEARVRKPRPKLDETAYEAPLLARPVKVAELG